MHSDSRIDEIRADHGGSISAPVIRDAVRIVERSTPAGVVLLTVATRDFLGAMVEAAEDRNSEEERAWLTLAAAGSRKVRLALAWQAANLLPRASVVDLLVNHVGDLRAECERRAEVSHEDEIQGPWLLLSYLWPRELARLVKAHPGMSGRYRQALNTRRAAQRRARVANRVGAGAPAAAAV
jgi:hypothetical protein